MCCSLLEQMYQVNVAGTTVVVGLAGQLFYIYDVRQMCAGARSRCSGTVHDARAGVHVGQQRRVGLVVCVRMVLMHVFVRMVCEWVEGQRGG